MSVNELNLEWTESGQLRSRRVQVGQFSKHPGTLRIGRDPAQCDVIISDLTVSGLHVEIYLNSSNHQFYLRNLRETNPPIVNQQPLLQGEVALSNQNKVRLGQVELQVTRVQPAAVSPTVVNQPAPISYPAAVNVPLPVQQPVPTPGQHPALPPLEPEQRNPMWIILGIALLLIGGSLLTTSLKDVFQDTLQQRPASPLLESPSPGST